MKHYSKLEVMVMARAIADGFRESFKKERAGCDALQGRLTLPLPRVADFVNPERFYTRKDAMVTATEMEEDAG